MGDFNKAVDFVLENEKGLSENPNDAGGITNFGISLRFLRELPSENLRRYGIFEITMSDQTIRDLTRDQAKFIYRGEFWEVAPFEKIKSQRVCDYVFDMACNCGVAQSIKIIQRSLWAVFFNRDVVKDDGILGEQTLTRLNFLSDNEILPVLIANRASYYRLLAEIRPKDKENLNGWLNRCYRI